EILRDVAGELADHRRRRLLVGTHDVAQLLGIEALRQLGRSHQVAEHHRQLPALGVGRVDGIGRHAERRPALIAESGDRSIVGSASLAAHGAARARSSTARRRWSPRMVQTWYGPRHGEAGVLSQTAASSVAGGVPALLARDARTAGPSPRGGA